MNWHALLIAIFPSACAARLIWELWVVRTLRRAGIQVTGQVVEQHLEVYKYVSIVRFTTQQGQLVEAESANRIIRVDIFDGESVELMYDPTHPDRFLLLQELASTNRYWLLSFVGLFVIVSLTAVWQ